MEFLALDGPPRRYYCGDATTSRRVWPLLFTRRVPAARPFCRWAARRGAAVHFGLRLRLHAGRGCCVVASRDIPAGRPLVSIPTRLAPAAHNAADKRETLAAALARELHNPHSPYRPYLEFLHDVYNTDMHDRYGSLQEELDTLYMGNAMNAKGVENAPFIQKNTLVTPSQRVEWIRLHAMLRQIEQSLPHFASKSASWGISMTLSRAIYDDNGGLNLYPIIDFCLHSFEPNSVIRITNPGNVKDKGIGLKGHDEKQPCVHLFSTRTITAGEPITLLYSPRRVRITEDAEYWKLRWGYVPN
ncbi:SET domain [Trypanosoma melophagium]|uniref:SET domain n=1 Tax=Trypanosoma melophagium TaxID=715481 RepID=UPI00351A9C68|nr:SET domain [Trypanosoma melophagium]